MNRIISSLLVQAAHPAGWKQYFVCTIAQQCFGLSDEGIEDAIYDSMAIRNFVGIDLNVQTAPDATTLLKFRRLLEDKDLTKRVFATINNLLNMQGLILKEGTVVDSTIISAPSSTKNEDKARDPTACCMEKKSWCLPMQFTKALKNGQRKLPTQKRHGIWPCDWANAKLWAQP